MSARLLLRSEVRRGLAGHVAVVAMLAGVAAALTVATVIGRVATKPWERTWRATGSAHLTLFATHAEGLRAVPGVTATSGPRVSGFVGLHAGSLHVETRLIERSPGPGRAVIVDGSEPGPDEVLLERSFARELGVGPGARVAFDAPDRRRAARVSALAVVSDQEPYPFAQPGLAFGSRALIDAVVPDARLRFYTESVRLADPGAAPGLEARLGERGASWQAQRADVEERLVGIRVALELLSALMLLCAAPIVATLVSERILARARELAILRAGGVTPGGIVILTGALYATLGALGGVLGLGLGTLLAPVVSGASVELLSAPGMVGPAPLAAVPVVAGTAALAGLAAALPAWLLARRPAAEALANAATGGRRRPSRLARAARRARLPLPAVVGAGEAFARRPRALLAILALSLSIAAAVAAVTVEADRPGESAATVERELTTTADPGDEPFDVVSSSDDEVDVRGVVYPGVGMLLALGLANLVAVLALAQREGRRDTGILRAVGLTPRDTSLVVVARQLTLTLVAAAAGIPLGLGLVVLATAMSDGDLTLPPVPLLAATGLAALVACTLVTAPLARRAARLPVTTVLRQD
jgi:ABC-type lipoprotein release transport system permease subunit